MSRHFYSLRHAHPSFTFESFEILESGRPVSAASRTEGRSIEIRLRYQLENGPRYEPSLVFTFPEALDLNLPLLRELTFHIGLIEAISYWKASCAPKFVVRAGSLTPVQLEFWRTIFYLGLGEFRYQNGIESTQEEFVEFICEGNPQPDLDVLSEKSSAYLLPVSGGKDSRVSLTLLNGSGLSFTPFLLNPLPAATRAIEELGINLSSCVQVRRRLDPVLFTQNEKGYLNGHTPFSALLAFLSTFAASHMGAKGIALSNERSADETNLAGEDINHQYSKSTRFERDFRNYVYNLSPQLPSYFSLLRPLGELQITALLAKSPSLLQSFRSCNRGDKEDRWCGECPKCLFVYLMLSVCLPKDELRAVFSADLLDQPELWPILEGLMDDTKTKPFECVGTREEVLITLRHHRETQSSYIKEQLVQRATSRYASKISSAPPLEETLKSWNADHFLPKELEHVVRKAVTEL